MGYIFTGEETEGFGEYSAEIRRESFYMSGEFTGVWARPAVKDRKLTKGAEVIDNNGVYWEIRREDAKPRGEDWQYRHFKMRHGIIMYPVRDDINQGTVEILIEDIPKIRAVLDAVERKRGIKS